MLTRVVPCVDAETIARFVTDGLPPPEQERLDEHLADCAACRELVASLASLRPSEPDVDETAEALSLSPGAQLGRYRVTSRLGEGASGVVWGAVDTVLGRRVALKLRAKPSQAHSQTRAILHEAQAIARLAHPQVAAIYDLGEAGGHTFIAMEWVEGESLRTRISRAPLSVPQATHIFAQAAEALAAAHAAGLVHRDFKPDNVLVDDRDLIKVIDFGVARLETSAFIGGDAAADSKVVETREGALVGTPLYMAPELFGGARAEAASDQFAFGATLYECLAGRHPFASARLGELRERHAAPLAPLPPGTPSRLRTLIARMLAVDPARRFASMDEVATILRDGARATRARRIVVGVAALVLVGAVSLAAILTHAARGDVSKLALDASATTAIAELDAALARRDDLTAERRIFALDARATIARDVRLASATALRAGRLAASRGDTQKARAAYRRALATAEAVGDDAIRAEVLVTLIYFELVLRRDLAAASMASELADAVLARASTDALLRAKIRRAQGVLAMARGDLDRARTLLEEGAEAARAANDPVELAGQLIGLSRHAMTTNDAHRAVELARHALEVWRTANGTDPGGEIKLRIQLGAGMLGAAMLAPASVELEQARRDGERLLGGANPDTLHAAHMQSVALELLGRPRDALEIAAAAHGRASAELARHPFTGELAIHVALLAIELGDNDRAEAALDTLAQLPDAADRAPAKLAIGRLALARRQPTLALAALREARAKFELQRQQTYIDIIRIASLAEALRELDADAEAREVLERATSSDRDLTPGARELTGPRLQHARLALAPRR